MTTVEEMRDADLAPGPAAVPPQLAAAQLRRGAAILRWLRVAMIVFFVAVLISEPPARDAGWCWAVVGGYLVWTLVVDVVRGSSDRVRQLPWTGLLVDMAVLATLTLITYTSANVSWTPYLVVTGFFVIPVMAAAQLSPLVCIIVAVPAVGVFLGSGLVIRHLDDEPVAYVLLRTLLLAAVSLGAVLLCRLQRSRVEAITSLLGQRNALLTELVTLQEREQRQLAETLHDGALQYVLAARQELGDAVEGDQESARRTDEALSEAGRLLRATTSQLHPAVLEAAGLPAALADLVRSVEARGRFVVDLEVDGWDDRTRTAADGLILETARELVTNVVKHAGAHHVRVGLRRADGTATLVVVDDGVGMSGTDLDTRLRSGHLGLASRRIRVEAAGGSLEIRPVQPHGTQVRVRVPAPDRSSRTRPAQHGPSTRSP